MTPADITAAAARVDEATLILADLDFTPVLPCEHSQHDTHHDDLPAVWVAHFWCPCGRNGTYLACESARQRARTLPTICIRCGMTRSPDDVTITFAPIWSIS